MGDVIVVALVAGLIFFMIKRGGCCGGHSHGVHNESKKNKSCCGVDNENVNGEK